MTVWSEFQPLKSVILGRLFETNDLLSFLSLSPKWKQHFQLINDKGIEELEAIKNCLQSLNVEVQRTSSYTINDKLGPAGPALSPRDWYCKYGDKTIIGNDAFINHNIRTYSTDNFLNNVYRLPHNDIWANTSFNDLENFNLNRPYMHTANILRCGMDIFVSKNLGRTGNEEGRSCVVDIFKQINPKLRLHYIDCEEHLDGYIFFVKPGLVISKISKQYLPSFFANWDVIKVDENLEVYNKVMQFKWKKFNPIVAQQYAWFLQSTPEETLFSINGLCIDESNIVLPGISKTVFKELEKFGINCISVNMKALSYWDSGLHCCTSEIERIGDLEDYS